MKLKDIQCRQAKPREKQYKLADGGGLYLLVKPNGNKHWRLKYRIHGKEKLLAIGPYPLTSLLEARQARDDAKRLLANGEDPVLHKKKVKHPRAGDSRANRNSPTGSKIAGSCLLQRLRWQS